MQRNRHPCRPSSRAAISAGLLSLMLACGGGTEPDQPPATDGSVPVDSASSDASAGAFDAGPAAGSCADGDRNGDETDVDCGGGCGPCANTRACSANTDCLSERCVDDACTSPPGTHPDIVRIDDVPGRDPGGVSWMDSYSVGGACYCDSTFDHGIGGVVVDTPAGQRTIREVCDAIGAGPGRSDRPIYNDIQCGNGPANNAGDEDDCPGRVDIGREGCGHVGPTWDLSVLLR